MDNVPFQKIDDAARTTGLSRYFLRTGCKNGSVPCVKSGTTYFINVPVLLQRLNDTTDTQGRSAGARRVEG